MKEVTEEERDATLFQTSKRLGWPQQVRSPLGVWLPRWLTARQFAVLLHRSMRLALRERFLIGLQLVQMVIMAVLIGTVFLSLPNTVASLQRRSSALFFCAINQGMNGGRDHACGCVCVFVELTLSCRCLWSSDDHQHFPS